MVLISSGIFNIVSIKKFYKKGMNMNHFFSVLVIGAYLTLSQSANAKTIFSNDQQFYNFIQKFKAVCDADNINNEQICKNGFSTKILFNQSSGINNLDIANKNQLSKIATSEASKWADTILEGDYMAFGDTQLSTVIGIYKNNQLIAYRITYQEDAIRTDECENEKESLTTCTQGIIVESGFVSADFTQNNRDDDNIAEFYN